MRASLLFTLSAKVGAHISMSGGLIDHCMPSSALNFAAKTRVFGQMTRFFGNLEKISKKTASRFFVSLHLIVLADE